MPISASYQPKLLIIFQFYFADKKIADTFCTCYFLIYLLIIRFLRLNIAIPYNYNRYD